MNISLHAPDFAALSPLLILLSGGLVLLLLESFNAPAAKKYSFLWTLVTLVAALYATQINQGSENPLLTPWLRFDSITYFFSIFFISTTLAVTLLAAAFFRRFEASHGEFYFLILSSLFGLLLIAASADFLTLFLGIETLSIPLYILCGYMKRWGISQEASTKYFLIGAVSTALFLYGIALIYGAVGTTQFNDLLEGYRQLSNGSDKTLFLSGIALVTFGLAFKAALVPFHVWAPDVYDGAPTPVTAFMAVGTKAGAFAAFVRVFFDALPGFDPQWNEGLALLAYPTLIYANLVALKQVQLRRFFAYSGISHAGFLLIPLAAGGSQALPSLEFYLVVYGLATLGCFAVLAYLDEKMDGATLNDLQGLFRRAPLTAGFFSLYLLTLAGIPPTAGFFAKFYIFKVAFDAGYYGLILVGLLTTILSAYYYLRMVGLMLSEKSIEEAPPRLLPAAIVGTTALAAIIFISIYPAPLLEVIESLNFR